MRRLLAPTLLLLLMACPPAPAEEQPHCVTCGGAIEGRYRYVNLDGHRYAFHPQHKPGVCWFCGGVLARYAPWGTGRHNPEGFDLCSRCDAEGVRDQATAQALLNEVRQSMVGWGLTFPWGKIPVRLGGPGELPGQGAWRELGLCKTRRVGHVGLDDSKVDGLTVLIMRGMPRSTFKGVVAHELTHAWSQLKNCPRDQDPALREGGANLIEYFYLQPDDSPAARHLKKQMLAEKTGVYGGGFHRLLGYAEHHRVRGVLTLLMSQRSIPAGY